MKFKFEKSDNLNAMAEPVPSRLFYVKSVQNVVAQPLGNGDFIADDLRIFWGGDDATLNVTDKGEDWLLEFSRKPVEYISLSWAFTLQEIEMLRSSSFVSLGTKKLEPIAKKYRDFNYSGRMVAAKGRRTKSLERAGSYFEARHQVSFGMSERKQQFYEFAFFDANKIWIDFIIEIPQYKNWLIGKPQLWMQEANPF